MLVTLSLSEDLAKATIADCQPKIDLTPLESMEKSVTALITLQEELGRPTEEGHAQLAYDMLQVHLHGQDTLLSAIIASLR